MCARFGMDPSFVGMTLSVGETLAARQSRHGRLPDTHLVDLAAAAADVVAQLFQAISLRQCSRADAWPLGSQDEPLLAQQMTFQFDVAAVLRQQAIPFVE